MNQAEKYLAWKLISYFSSLLQFRPYWIVNGIHIRNSRRNSALQVHVCVYFITKEIIRPNEIRPDYKPLDSSDLFNSALESRKSSSNRLFSKRIHEKYKKLFQISTMMSQPSAEVAKSARYPNSPTLLSDSLSVGLFSCSSWTPSDKRSAMVEQF